MEYPITYIYELYRGKKLFYLGKTVNPVSRYTYHIGTFGRGFKMKIIDKYVDLEHKYLHDYSLIHKNITNKGIPKNTEREYEIGEIIFLKKKTKNFKIWDENLQKEFQSIYECQKHYNITTYYIRQHLFDNKPSEILKLKLI